MQAIFVNISITIIVVVMIIIIIITFIIIIIFITIIINGFTDLFGPRPFFCFMIVYKIVRTPWTEDQPRAWPTQHSVGTRPQDHLRRVQGEFVTGHPPGAPQPFRAACTRHGRLH
jgi:hypothetical protein